MRLRNSGGASAALNDTENAPHRAAPGRKVPWRVVLAVIWPPALVVSVYLAVGRLGFYPTDEGLIQAYAYRILQGQVPHRDFISPRPVGSALLHLIDFAVPGPLFEVSRAISLCEFVAYSVLFAWLISAVAPWRWGIAMVAGVAGSVLLNLNVFPLMAWYTVDGLLLVSVGLVVVQFGVSNRSSRVIAIGFLIIGSSALTKQSFVPAPAIAWLLLLPRLREERWPRRVFELVATGALSAVPSMAFIGTISALGGFQQLRAQLLGGTFVYGRPLAAAWSPHHDLLALASLVGATTVLFAALELGVRRHRANEMLLLGGRIALSLLVVAVPLVAGLGMRGNEWGTRLFWMAAGCLLGRSIARGSPDTVGIIVIGAAWMSSISYGYPYPNLLGGSVALYMLHRTWSEHTWADRALSRALPTIAAVVGFALTAYVFGSSRQQDVYMDRPADRLTASLTGVSAAFGDIRTNPVTAQYLHEMAECIREYPARYVAVLPENAALYPALSLTNPFPIDWMWADDVHGSESRIVASADLLNREGDYLVLFQTVGEPQIVTRGTLPAASADSAILAYTSVTTDIYARLNGVRAICGSFMVVYSAPATN